jgi:hypothetical protein
MSVHQAGHYRLARCVYDPASAILRHDLTLGADCSNAIASNRNCASLDQAALRVHSYNSAAAYHQIDVVNGGSAAVIDAYCC